jgi:hypothetical protein
MMKTELQLSVITEVRVFVCVAAARSLLRQRHRSDSRRSHARPLVVRPAMLHGSTCSALPCENGG